MFPLSICVLTEFPYCFHLFQILNGNGQERTVGDLRGADFQQPWTLRALGKVMLFLHFRNKFSQINNAINGYYGPRERINSHLIHNNQWCELEQRQESKLETFLPFFSRNSLPHPPALSTLLLLQEPRLELCWTEGLISYCPVKTSLYSPKSLKTLS